LAPWGSPPVRLLNLGYEDLWLKSLPGGFISLIASLWLVLRFVVPRLNWETTETKGA
jgi:hypothetical protein